MKDMHNEEEGDGLAVPLPDLLAGTHRRAAGISSNDSVLQMNDLSGLPVPRPAVFVFFLSGCTASSGDC